MVLMFEQKSVGAMKGEGSFLKDVFKSLSFDFPLEFSLVMSGDEETYTLFQGIQPVVGGLSRTNADNLLFSLSKLFKNGHGQSLLFILKKPAAVVPDFLEREVVDEDGYFLLDYLLEGDYYKDVYELAQGVFGVHPTVAKDLTLKGVSDFVDAPNEQFLLTPYGILYFPY